jgi:diaminopimelate decarboxylase
VNFPAARVILRVDAKTPADLRAALRYGADRIVVDSTAEIVRLATLTPCRARAPATTRRRPTATWWDGHP